MLTAVHDLLWGPGTLTLLLGTGIFLTFRMRFLPLRTLPFAIRSALSREARQSGKSGISPFSALMTTLAATIGTGNIVGVSTALVAGGPGALIWMELSALFGLATIFTESALSVKYRRRDPQGQWYGGPMYVLEHAFGLHLGSVLGRIFALFAVGASLGLGAMTQANAIVESLHTAFSLPAFPVTAIIVILSLPGILGGTGSISRITAVLVPLMSVFYLLASLFVIVSNPQNLLPGVVSMFRCAFSPNAIAGGMAGDALRWGVTRGVFSNEAGLGSAGIAAAAADAASPARQGLIGMTGAFFDTTVICTATGLAICCSGVLDTADPLGTPVSGAALTIRAFETVLGTHGAQILAVSLVLFAFSTILGWEFQGEQAFVYLSRGRACGLYRTLYILALFWGAGQQPDTVYLFSDVCNALMCMPNLICVLVLNGEAVKEIRRFSGKAVRKNVNFSG